MRRGCMLLILISTGCSTHPIAGLQDYFLPGHVGTADVQPYGGVCIPQGPVQPPLPQAPVILQPPTPPGPPIIPPAAPLPGAPPAAAPPGAVPPPPAFPPGR
jgi:hypothetical protein